MNVMDGRIIASQIKREIQNEVLRFVKNGGKRPHLGTILVGNNGSSEIYVAQKIKTCKELGFISTLIRHEEMVTEKKLLSSVDMLNKNNEIDGFIVQLPLPNHISTSNVIEKINYRKDVDGFHPINVGRMSLGLPCFVSATPLGIMELLKRYKIKTAGKHCVILGRSNIVGKPIANLLMKKTYPGDCTVTVCHSKSVNISCYCVLADIIIVALGIPGFLKKNMVKKGAVVIDVGITRVSSLKSDTGFVLRGDVDFDEVSPLCSYISLAPGGVGPMTIVSLMRNTLLAAQKTIYQ